MVKIEHTSVWWIHFDVFFVTWICLWNGNRGKDWHLTFIHVPYGRDGQVRCVSVMTSTLLLFLFLYFIMVTVDSANFYIPCPSSQKTLLFMVKTVIPKTLFLSKTLSIFYNPRFLLFPISLLLHPSAFSFIIQVQSTIAHCLAFSPLS